MVAPYIYYGRPAISEQARTSFAPLVNSQGTVQLLYGAGYLEKSLPSGAIITLSHSAQPP